MDGNFNTAPAPEAVNDFRSAQAVVNRAGLQRLVDRAIAEAPTKDDPVRYLRINADKVTDWLAQLSRAAAFDRPVPAHMVGLGSMDLSDAADKLNAEANRIARGVA